MNNFVVNYADVILILFNVFTYNVNVGHYVLVLKEVVTSIMSREIYFHIVTSFCKQLFLYICVLFF